ALTGYRSILDEHAADDLAQRTDREGRIRRRCRRRAPQLATALAIVGGPMESQPALNLIPTIQQAISNLLTTHEPEFLRFGFGLFTALATIVLAWQGIRLMFSSEPLTDKMFDFAKALLFVSFGYALITFYESPLPGIGVSF